LPTPRRVSIVNTNPGGTDSWPFQRFLVPGHRADRVAVEVSAADRLTEAEQAAQHETFRNAPDLQARLARGEWADLILGPQVAKGFNPRLHVAPKPLEIWQGTDFWLGWDSAPNAHVHALVVGQRNGLKRNVLAGLVMEDTGLKQFLLQAVLPWFSKFAPWILSGRGKEYLLHRYDPAMDTYEGGDAELHPLARLRHALGGSFAPGGTDWPDRAGPMLDLLAEGDGKGGMALQISPVPETLMLRQALTSRWYYAQTKGGAVIRDLPYKPNHPWEDLGDSFAYWCGGVAPSVQRPRRREGPHPKNKGGLGAPWALGRWPGRG
jgi:hypothetical protein